MLKDVTHVKTATSPQPLWLRGDQSAPAAWSSGSLSMYERSPPRGEQPGRSVVLPCERLEPDPVGSPKMPPRMRPRPVAVPASPFRLPGPAAARASSVPVRPLLAD